MKVLIDTNIILDALLGRKPFCDNADSIMRLCSEKRLQGYIAAHSIPNIFYILRKEYSEVDRREILSDICSMLRIVPVDGAVINEAIKNDGMSDFEDAIQCECALVINADYIVTRNINDFAESKIAAVLPEILLEKI